jgi:hypothetical protein
LRLGLLAGVFRGAPSVTLEEADRDEVIVRIAATPSNPGDGPRLATEVPRAIEPHVWRVGVIQQQRLPWRRTA